MLVDDKASIRGTMRRILANLGLSDITEAVDGEEAWQKLSTVDKNSADPPFELIVSDMEMPRMSGLELLKAVRQDKTIKDTPFIMATTVTAKEIILETMRLGVQAYIIKPFDASVVELKLRQAGIL